MSTLVLNVLAVHKPHNKWDSLDSFVMVAKTVPDDAKQLTTTISTNVTLFRPGPGKGAGRSVRTPPVHRPAGSRGQLLPAGGPSPALNKPLPPSLGKEQPTVAAAMALKGAGWMIMTMSTCSKDSRLLRPDIHMQGPGSSTCKM